MWLSNGVVQRALMQVKDAGLLVGTGIGGRELPLDKGSEEVRRVLSVSNAGEGAVVAVHADSGVQHDRDQKTRLSARAGAAARAICRRIQPPGLRTGTPKVTLTVGQVAEMRISLSVAAFAGKIQVVGSAAAVEIETTKSDLSAVVNQEQLAELPVLNRGFVGLAQLLPGGGPARTDDSRFGINTAFGGTNVRSMYSMQIDGGVMDHPIYGFAIVQ